jgi:betaine-aldehyde dehydrogenase
MQIEIPLLRNFIGGDWIPSSSGEVIISRNPATGEEISRSQKSTVQDVRMAIEAAENSFNTTDWRYEPSRRADCLHSLVKKIRDHAESLSNLMTVESGKPIRVSRFEVARAADIIDYYSGLCRNVFGRATELSRQSLDLVVREPVGIVGIISPWNWPLVLLVRSMAPALAAGNTVVVKPASYTPAINIAFFQLLSTINEFDKGVVNCVTGPGEIVGSELATNNKVNMISFTGDTVTGKKIVQMSSNSIKKLSLELGGKSPSIIFADAQLDNAIKGCLSGAWLSCAGQVCYASTRLIVHRKIHAEFVRKFKDQISSLKVGNGLDETVDVGPIISETQLDDVLNYIETGKQEANLVIGGRRLTEGNLSKGFFVAPTIFDEVRQGSRIEQEEIFGPVVTVSPFETEEEAIQMANNTIYGLAGSVWTKDVDTAIRVAKQVRAGTVWVNSYSSIPPSMEYGGYKQSGIGRMLGLEGLHEFTEMKHIGLHISS